MALANLERFMAAAPRVEATLAHLCGDPRATEILLQVFSTSQYFSEVLIRDPVLLEWLQSGPARPDRSDLIGELWSTLSDLASDDQAARWRCGGFRQRESLRIGYNDIVRGFPLEMITQDLSDLADACVEAAVRLAWSHAQARYGDPMTPQRLGRPVRRPGLGQARRPASSTTAPTSTSSSSMTKMGQTTGPKVVSSAEMFARMGSEIVRLLADHTALGMAYRVDMRLRPDGEQGRSPDRSMPRSATT